MFHFPFSFMPVHFIQFINFGYFVSFSFSFLFIHSTFTHFHDHLFIHHEPALARLFGLSLPGARRPPFAPRHGERRRLGWVSDSLPGLPALVGRQHAVGGRVRGGGGRQQVAHGLRGWVGCRQFLRRGISFFIIIISLFSLVFYCPLAFVVCSFFKSSLLICL